MAASQNVPEDHPSIQVEPLTPRHGVISLTGYGIVARVEKGHLFLRDAIGTEQREGRFPRIGHGIKRLVIVGCEGMITLGALRWLHDQRAAFVMLERNGNVLTAAGPSGPKDSRLRRAQALAMQDGRGLSISRDLIDRKLAAQEHIARQTLTNEDIAGEIASVRASLPQANAIDGLRWFEARAALAYWSAWHNLPIAFPKSAQPRVPTHWRRFGARRSSLTGSPRLAVNPPNAVLNYLYAILEAEARIAAVVVGLDPNLGFMHVDTDSRASLACDLMEAVRPSVDAFVLRWLMNESLRRDWFFEERSGNCRLMAACASFLSDTAQSWAREVGPIAERVAALLLKDADAARRPTKGRRRERIALGRVTDPSGTLPRAPRVCHSCGGKLRAGRARCARCLNAERTETYGDVLAQGRATANTADARAKRSTTRRRNAEAESAWTPADAPAWLTPKFYARTIRPALTSLGASAIGRALGVSRAYGAHIRKGERTPHPRHWLTLMQLAKIEHPTREDA